MKYVDYIILKMNMLHIRQILNNADNRRDIKLSDDLYEKAGSDVQGLTSSKEKTRTSSLEYVRERHATSSLEYVRERHATSSLEYVRERHATFSQPPEHSNKLSRKKMLCKILFYFLFP